jgi:hypothetical protein
LKFIEKCAKIKNRSAEKSLVKLFEWITRVQVSPHHGLLQCWVHTQTPITEASVIPGCQWIYTDTTRPTGGDVQVIYVICVPQNAPLSLNLFSKFHGSISNPSNVAFVLDISMIIVGPTRATICQQFAAQRNSYANRPENLVKKSVDNKNSTKIPFKIEVERENRFCQSKREIEVSSLPRTKNEYRTEYEINFADFFHLAY